MIALENQSMNTAVQAEYNLLSIAFNWLPAIEYVSDTLSPADFSDRSNGEIYKFMLNALAKGEKEVDIVSVFDALQGEETLAHIHAISIACEGGGKSIQQFAKLIVSKARERQLFRVSQTIATLAFSAGDINSRIDEAQAELGKLAPADVADEWIDAHAGAIAHLELIEARECGKNLGIPTGFYTFDEMLDGGMQRGNLIVIGARPSMGKTAIALTLGLHVAKQYHVGFLSMEMTHADLRDRQTAILGQLSMSDIKRPSKRLAYDRVVDAVEKSKALKFYASDKSGLNILQVRSRARALQRAKGLDVLVVDYIGLMPGLEPKQPRAYQIEEISKGLKSLAKELGIAVVCLAQVNRGGADRGNNCPGLSDLRDSGAIEQDADVVGFVHRPIMVDPNLDSQWQDYALFRVAKNRQGRTGDVHLYYIGQQTRFGSWSGEVPTNSVKKSKGTFE